MSALLYPYLSPVLEDPPTLLDLDQPFRRLLLHLSPAQDELALFDWARAYVEKGVSLVVQGEVDRVLTWVKGKFGRAYLAKGWEYMREAVLPWVRAMAPCKQWDKEAEEQLLCEFVSVRTTEMFGLFQDFPDSLPAINDLKEALERTKLHSVFAEKVKE